jgi:FtsP/CotA-like multicopper oxidase with cupredoxin domain
MRHPAVLSAGRRRALKALGSLAGAPLCALFPVRATAQSAIGGTCALRAAPATVALLGNAGPPTNVWAYNGSVPGPMLRVRQGDTLRVRVANDLAEATTVHWHGLRLPNAMDGVPMVTQDPIAAGGTFDYAFACPDAGTFWYHPHQRSHVQVALGLAGVLIVEEPVAPDVDRDVVWVLDDWRLNRDGQLVADFDSMFDASHAGRIGNTVTINGALPDRFDVVPGERIRLRLVNVANARIFALRFEGHAPYVIAHDGMPCEPYLLRQARVLLGPGMRVDLVLDATAAPGATFRVIDDFFPNDAYEVVTLAYGAQAASGAGVRPAGERLKLPPNPVPPPDTDRAIRHALTLSGGMMGGGMMGSMMGGMTGMGAVWALNGLSATEAMSGHDPLFTMERGRTHVIAIDNRTAWWHPIHLHGHSFRIVARNGRSLTRRDLCDTTLIPPRESAEIAFVADNPGDWMLHCHVLEHQATGMMATYRVA